MNNPAAGGRARVDNEWSRCAGTTQRVTDDASEIVISREVSNPCHGSFSGIADGDERWGASLSSGLNSDDEWRRSSREGELNGLALYDTRGGVDGWIGDGWTGGLSSAGGGLSESADSSADSEDDGREMHFGGIGVVDEKNSRQKNCCGS